MEGDKEKMCDMNKCQATSSRHVTKEVVDVENMEGCRPKEKMDEFGFSGNQSESAEEKKKVLTKIENQGEERIGKVEEPEDSVVQIPKEEVSGKEKLDTEHPHINAIGGGSLTDEMVENERMIIYFTEAVKSLEGDLDKSRQILESNLFYEALEFHSHIPDQEYLSFLNKVNLRMLEQVYEYEQMIAKLQSKLSSAKK